GLFYCLIISVLRPQFFKITYSLKVRYNKGNRTESCEWGIEWILIGLIHSVCFHIKTFGPQLGPSLNSAYWFGWSALYWALYWRWANSLNSSLWHGRVIFIFGSLEAYR